jgi:serine/threonine protein kinase
MDMLKALASIKRPQRRRLSKDLEGRFMTESRSLEGETILGYKAIERIGGGAFGNVYKVRKETIAQETCRALKHIRIQSGCMPEDSDIESQRDLAEILKQVTDEVNILSSLSGTPGVVQYYDHDVAKDGESYDVYILMELLEPLAALSMQPGFTARKAIQAVIDILEGLKACHAMDIVHRDIKPGNILIDSRGRAKLADFGIAKALEGGSAHTVIGTPGFVAPEVITNPDGYNKSVDIYSVGITLYYLLNCHRGPFLPDFPKPCQASDRERAYRARVSWEKPNLPLLGGNLVGEVVLRAIDAPGKRLKDAEEFQQTLKKALAQTSDSELDIELSNPGEALARKFANDKRVIGFSRDKEVLIEESTVPIEAGGRKPEQSRKSYRIVPAGRQGGIAEVRPPRKSQPLANVMICLTVGLAALLAMQALKVGIVPSVVFWLCWFATFGATLFQLAFQLNKKPDANAAGALMRGNAPWLMMKEIMMKLELSSRRTKEAAMPSVLKTAKALEEKLSVSSGFGVDPKVTELENSIAQRLEGIKGDCLRLGGEGALDDIHDGLVCVNALLGMRTLLLTR